MPRRMACSSSITTRRVEAMTSYPKHEKELTTEAQRHREEKTERRNLKKRKEEERARATLCPSSFHSSLLCASVPLWLALPTPDYSGIVRPLRAACSRNVPRTASSKALSP